MLSNAKEQSKKDFIEFISDILHIETPWGRKFNQGPDGVLGETKRLKFAKTEFV